MCYLERGKRSHLLSKNASPLLVIIILGWATLTACNRVIPHQRAGPHTHLVPINFDTEYAVLLKTLRMSSIDNENEREIAEAPAEHTLADGSVGSDTETTKTLISDDASKDASENPHHARSNSIKKPATFKAVSVTKNFLAKAGTAPAPNAKVNGDKSKPSHAHVNIQPYIHRYVGHHNDNNCASPSS